MKLKHEPNNRKSRPEPNRSRGFLRTAIKYLLCAAIGCLLGWAVSGIISYILGENTSQLKSNIKQVALGATHTCALTNDGRVLCWGSEQVGQLGDGTMQYSSITEPTLVLGLGGVAEIELGHAFSCALGNNSNVSCWGSNEHGQIGDGTTSTRTTPTEIPGLSGVTEIGLGGAHACAVIQTSGEMKCWGLNEDGQLGNGTTTTAKTPVSVPGLSKIARISLGGSHTCAIDSRGSLYCWGFNKYGQVGDGTTNNRNTPVVVHTGVKDVALGHLHTCAIKTDNSLLCWGINAAGQVGVDTSDKCAENTPCARSPTEVSGIKNVSSVSLGTGHTCALEQDGDLWCWGRNREGQLGIGTTGSARHKPEKAASDMSDISLGRSHTCGQNLSGVVYCWGLNDVGQLGDGTLINKSSPIILDTPQNYSLPDQREELEHYTMSDDTTNAVVQVVVIDTQTGRVSRCGGVLVAENLILTARHCVAWQTPGTYWCNASGELQGEGGRFDRSKGTLWVFSGTFVPYDFIGKGVPAGTPRGVKIFHDGAVHCCGHDFAAVLLDRPITGVKPATFDLSQSPKAGQRVTVFNWLPDASGARKQRVQRESEIVMVGPSKDWLPPNEFVVSPSSSKGCSGSPAIDSKTGSVIGIGARFSVEAQKLHGIQFSQLDKFKDTVTKALKAATASRQTVVP